MFNQENELAPAGLDNTAEASGSEFTSVQGQSSHLSHDISLPTEDTPPNNLDNDMDPLQSPRPAIPALSATRHSQRQTRRPARFQDILPESSAFISPLSISTPTPPVARIVRLIVRDTLWTDYNAFGLRRHYMHRPTYEPDAFLTPEDLLAPNRHAAQSNAPVHIPLPTLTTSPIPSPTVTAELPPPWPLANMSKWLLMRWANNGKTTKSASEIDSLVSDVIMDPAFNAADLHGFRSETENTRLDREADAAGHPLFQSFDETTVNIEVPSGEPGVPPQPFPVPGLLHRKLTDVITAAFQETLSFRMHLSPHKIFHRSPGATEDIRVYGEMYTSDVFLEADDDVRLRGKLPPGQQGCTLEKIVAAMMLFSDATHLASFGNAKAWPIYLALGNLSKYVRACPTSDSMFHVAYIPSVSVSSLDLNLSTQSFVSVARFLPGLGYRPVSSLGSVEVRHKESQNFVST